MLKREKIDRYLLFLQAGTFCALTLEVAFVLYPRHPGGSVGLFVLAGVFRLSVCMSGWSSVKNDFRSTVMSDFIFILVLLGLSFETSLLGEHKWMIILTALVFLFSDLGRGINRLEQTGKDTVPFNKISNLLLLIQILMVNVLAVVLATSIFSQSKIVAIVLYLVVAVLFVTKEWRFFDLRRIWNATLKKELRCIPMIDVCCIVSFIYYCGYKDFSFVVVPVVFFFLIDLVRNFIEKKKVWHKCKELSERE